MNTILAIKSNSRETVDRLFDAKRLLSERPSHTLPAKVVKEHIYIYIALPCGTKIMWKNPKTKRHHYALHTPKN